jgi:hypothetical protein
VGGRRTRQRTDAWRHAVKAAHTTSTSDKNINLVPRTRVPTCHGLYTLATRQQRPVSLASETASGLQAARLMAH